MKQKRVTLFSLVITIVLFQGCFTLNQVGTSTDSAIEITNSQSATSIAHFTKTKKVNHFIFGLVSPEDSGAEKLISDEVKVNNGSRAVNVRMKYQHTFVDGLLRIITLGIYSPFTLTVSGDVVK